MKRPAKAQEENFEDFLKEFVLTVNEGVHDDLSRSERYLNKRGLENYIEERDGEEVCNLSAIEDNEDLTVQDVFELGVHWARYGVHDNWHDAMKEAAKNNGVNLEEYTADEARIETFGAEIPAEVVEAITKLSENLAKNAKTIKKVSSKKGGKKK